ncbi:DUF167 domain-containing protein [Candidatus Saganbacteria bacterium]|nr:DUF167 domain-containing protein [Candidatus Saganbacteria bacterium]
MTEILVEIRVIPNADHDELVGTRLYVTSPEHDSRTNEILIELMAEHYNVKKNRIKIMKGFNSIQKTVKII